MKKVLSLAPFSLGALCFVTFLATVKPMSFGVRQSSNSFTAARVLWADRHAANVKSMSAGIVKTSGPGPNAY